MAPAPSQPSAIRFGPFRLDVAEERLWKDDALVPIQPRPLAVLRHLAARPGQLVGREELIQSVWAGVHVSRAVLKVAVGAARKALGDSAEEPRYIETVGRVGYRFIGGDDARPRSSAGRGGSDALVGRGADLAALSAGFARAAAGERAIVFVTGEAGIGKTALVEYFVARLREEGAAWIARGHCLEQYGEGEAYLPILEAIGRLARADEGPVGMANVLRKHAPTWTAHLPALESTVSAAGAEPALGATQARMLREMADALEVFTRPHPLVLVLEDLQWSDRSTVDLVAYLARRREPARLMVVGTVRAADLIVHDHPLRAVKHELKAAGSCEERALELLSPREVTTFLEARLGGASSEPLQRLATGIHKRTEGNPLFVVNVVNDLVAKRILVRCDEQWSLDPSIQQATDAIPAGLRELIGERLRRLAPPMRRVLEAASIVGDEFAVTAVAAALDEDADRVEDECEMLALQGALIAEAGEEEWPDGSSTGCYRFRHTLYRHVLYEGIAASRRSRMHLAVGLRLETAFGDRAGQRAVQLAVHFTRGRDRARALEYHERAASAALDRHARHEAVAHFGAALDALAHAPDVPSRADRELGLAVKRATLLMATHGYAAPETEAAFARARALCDGAAASPMLYPVLRGLVSYHHVRAELAVAHELGELLLEHAARRPDDRLLQVQAWYGCGATLFHMGRLDDARTHLEVALRSYDAATHREHARVYGGYDPGVACSLWLAWTLALLGRLDDAVALDRQALATARRLPDPFSLAWALQGAGITAQLFGDWEASERASADAAAVAEEHGFPHVRAMATVDCGWAQLVQGRPAGIALLRDGVAAVEATGAALVRPMYLGMLAAADALEGDLGSAVRRIDDGLAELARTGERLHESGLLVGKGQMLAAAVQAGAGRRKADPVEACFQQALEVARAQQAKVFELRAALALARHWQARRRAADGRALVAAVYAPFAQARAVVPEVAAARQLLAELG